jgi:glyoxylase-like metal-dependent hydrolase (beta-lactamase superfamily II)
MQRRSFIKQSMAFSLTSYISLNVLNDLNAYIPAMSDQNLYPPRVISESPTIHTITVKSNGQEVKIHAIQTGQCAVKVSHKTHHVPHILTPIKITLDPHFTEYLPIWVWVIEHPEGVIVIDTGENAGVMNPDYFKPAGKMVAAYNRKNIKFKISEEEEIGHQLKQLNITSDKIKNVVLTHLHLDHTDGLYAFPSTEIIVPKEEFNHPSGNIPQLYPKWFKPRLVSYQKEKVDVFEDAFPITDREDVLLIPTNGHTPHHASVLFKTDYFDILFAGDVSYSESQLLQNDLPGINADYSKSLKTYRNIKEYAHKNKLIYLPSHDMEGAERLKDRKFLRMV